MLRDYYHIIIECEPTIITAMSEPRTIPNTKKRLVCSNLNTELHTDGVIFKHYGQLPNHVKWQTGVSS